MTDYARQNDFEAKDNLLTGNPLKAIKGVDVDEELDEIVTAVASKMDKAGGTFTGDVEVNASLTLQKGSDVASAATLPVNVAGNIFDVTTGAVTVTALASKGVGTVVVLQFDVALTLTHNATDLILPGGADITTVAGDVAMFVEYASADWRCISYQRAANTPDSAVITLGTQQSASGTSIDFTIPSGTKRITVMVDGVSLNGGEEMAIQIGPGTVETTGYISAAARMDQSINNVTDATQFLLSETLTASDALHGQVTLSLKDSSTNAWVSSGVLNQVGGSMHLSSGRKLLAGELTTLRFKSESSNTFDAGTVNVQTET